MYYCLCLFALPLGCLVVSANCPPGSGWSPPPPLPMSPGGRKAAVVPWVSQTAYRSVACSGAAPLGPPPAAEERRGGREKARQMITSTYHWRAGTNVPEQRGPN